jgi:hypothetical protein
MHLSKNARLLRQRQAALHQTQQNLPSMDHEHLYDPMDANAYPPELHIDPTAVRPGAELVPPPMNPDALTASEFADVRNFEQAQVNSG